MNTDKNIYNMKSRVIMYSVLFGASLFTAVSCTKLEPKPYSSLTTEEFYNNPKVVDNAQDLVTTALVSFGNGEQTRIGRSAGGEMLNLFAQQTDNSPYMEEAYRHEFKTERSFRYNLMWNTFYAGIAQANLTISELSSIKKKPDNVAKVLSDLKVARAFFFFHAMDNFGNIPLDTLYGADPNTVKTNSRLEVYNFIEKELLQNLDALDTRTLPNNRINRYVGYALLAQLYLNAQVYSGTPQWKKASDACDKVLEGPYSLSTNYFDNFAANNATNENLLVSFKDETVFGGNTSIQENVDEAGAKALGIVGNPWNSFSGASDYYALYQNTDARKRQWLAGDQFEALPGQRVIDGAINGGPLITVKAAGKTFPLSYKLDYTKFGVDQSIIKDRPIRIQKMNGARNVKYYPKQGGNNDNCDFGNDYVIMRLADVILMKAEAELRLGNVGVAAAQFNRIRQRAFGNASGNIINLTLKDIHDERIREFAWENYSRRDNIRFEVADPSTPYWSMAKPPLKPNADANPVSPGRFNNMIYFIPLEQLALNPNLVQNPGY